MNKHTESDGRRELTKGENAKAGRSIDGAEIDH
jgi:hypothetical protein